MKNTSSILRTLLLTGGLVVFVAFGATAQTTGGPTQVTPSSTATTPAKAIGPAPSNSPQKQILSSALSPETRQTLKQAMDSYIPEPAKPTAAGK